MRLKLFTLHCLLCTDLLRFPVRLVLPAIVAELLELEAARGRLLVLRRRIIPVLALSALQCDYFPHVSILTDSAFPAESREKVKK
jgi:hypothetical protein